MSKNDNYTTGNLLDYLYHQKYYKLMNKIIIVIKKSMYKVAMEQHLMEEVNGVLAMTMLEML